MAAPPAHGSLTVLLAPALASLVPESVEVPQRPSNPQSTVAPARYIVTARDAGRTGNRSWICMRRRSWRCYVLQRLIAGTGCCSSGSTVPPNATSTSVGLSGPSFVSSSLKICSHGDRLERCCFNHCECYSILLIATE